MINPARFQSVLGKVNDQQLMEMLKRPDKIPTQFVVAEINRRQSMRQSAKASQMAMAQRTPVMPNQNVQRMPPQGQPMPRQQQQQQQPQRMDEGGMPLPQRKPTVGQRNFNPMNLRPISGEPFFGTVGQRNGYTIFDNDLAGLRAGFVNMTTQAGKGVDTVDDYISAYAPVGENSAASVSNYKSFVADALGVGVDDKIDLTDPATQIKVADAQIKFENRGDDDYYQSLKTMLPQAQQMSRNKKDDPFGTVRRKVSTVTPSSPASSGVRPNIYQSIDDDVAAAASGDSTALSRLRKMASDDSVPATYGTDVQQYAARKLGQLTASRNTSNKRTSSQFGAGPSDAMFERYGDSVDNMGPPPQPRQSAASGPSLEDIARSQFRDRQDLPTGNEFPGPPKRRPTGSYIEDVGPRAERPDGTAAAGIYGIKGNAATGFRVPEHIGPEATTDDYKNQQELINRRAQTGSYIEDVTGGSVTADDRRASRRGSDTKQSTDPFATIMDLLRPDSSAGSSQTRRGGTSTNKGLPSVGGNAATDETVIDNVGPDTGGIKSSGGSNVVVKSPDDFAKISQSITAKTDNKALGDGVSNAAAEASKDGSGLGGMNLGQIGDLSFFETKIDGLMEEQKKLLDAYNDGTADLIKKRKELMDMLETQKRTPQNMMFRALIDFGLELASSPEANFTRALAGAAKAGIASFENMTKGEQDKLFKKYKMAYDLAATEFDHKMKGQKMALDMNVQLLSVADTLSSVGLRIAQANYYNRRGDGTKPPKPSTSTYNAVLNSFDLSTAMGRIDAAVSLGIIDPTEASTMSDYPRSAIMPSLEAEAMRAAQNAAGLTSGEDEPVLSADDILGPVTN